jgi:ubiquinone/menaquinone biosynthesis C-methylase UbiE
MLPYQMQVMENFVQMLQSETMDILEIGSDIGGEVVNALAEKTGANVVGINPSSEFPKLVNPKHPKTCFLRMDGRSMPFPDNSFDAILSVATMEHVNDLDDFMNEVSRVIKPKGIFYTEFSPIWSSALGHHVYAVVGSKEARFWKSGRNPIPDYAHLLWTPAELKTYLDNGPCSEELIDPIIQWIYSSDSLNRCFFEDYMNAFRKCSLVLQSLRLSHETPDVETVAMLTAKYGTDRNFRCSSISAVFRKLPDHKLQKLYCKLYWQFKCLFDSTVAIFFSRLRYVVGTVLFSQFPLLGVWYANRVNKEKDT